MNQKFIVSVVAVFVLLFVLGWVVHGWLLQADYAKFPNLMRPMAEVQSKWPFMVLAHLCTAAAFTWIYLKGQENKPWLAQGVRYGVAIAVLMTIPLYLIYHAVMPFPLDLVIKQMAYDTIAIVLAGVVLAWINRA